MTTTQLEKTLREKLQQQGINLTTTYDSYNREWMGKQVEIVSDDQEWTIIIQEYDEGDHNDFEIEYNGVNEVSDNINDFDSMIEKIVNRHKEFYGEEETEYSFTK